MPDAIPTSTLNPVPRAWPWDQRWSDLIFIHWEMPVEEIRSQLPPGLEVDTHEGRAWLGVVIFRLDVKLRRPKFLPKLTGLPEINVRTYVRHRDVPGVFFLSLHVSSRLAARVAQWLTPLPYRFAKLSYRNNGDGFRFQARTAHERLAIDAVPTGPTRPTVDGSREAFLLERYRVYTWDPRTGLRTAPASHPRWNFRDVQVTGNLSEWKGVPSRPADLMHYSEGVPVLFGRFHPAV